MDLRLEEIKEKVDFEHTEFNLEAEDIIYLLEKSDNIDEMGQAYNDTLNELRVIKNQNEKLMKHNDKVLRNSKNIGRDNLNMLKDLKKLGAEYQKYLKKNRKP